MSVMDPSVEAEYIAAIGARRCLQCNEYHFDDTAACWYCQDANSQANACSHYAIIETVDGDYSL